MIYCGKTGVEHYSIEPLRKEINDYNCFIRQSRRALARQYLRCCASNHCVGILSAVCSYVEYEGNLKKLVCLDRKKNTN